MIYNRFENLYHINCSIEEKSQKFIQCTMSDHGFKNCVNNTCVQLGKHYSETGKHIWIFLICFPSLKFERLDSRLSKGGNWYWQILFLVGNSLLTGRRHVKWEMNFPANNPRDSGALKTQVIVAAGNQIIIWWCKPSNPLQLLLLPIIDYEEYASFAPYSLGRRL